MWPIVGQLYLNKAVKIEKITWGNTSNIMNILENLLYILNKEETRHYNKNEFSHELKYFLSVPLERNLECRSVE